MKISVGSRSVLGRRLVVRYGLQSLPNVLGVVGGQILFKFVTVFRLAGLDGIFRFISRFLYLSLSLALNASCFT